MKKPLIGILLATLLWGAAAAAQTTPPATDTFCSGGSCTYTVLEPLPGMPVKYGCPANDPNCPTSFGRLVGDGYKLLVGLGAIVAVVVLILGALTYMFSDVVNNKLVALKRIRSAMWAIVLLASSWLILSTINPQLTIFNLTLRQQKGPAATAPPPAIPDIARVDLSMLNNKVEFTERMDLDSQAGRDAFASFEGRCRNMGGVPKPIQNEGGFSVVTGCVVPQFQP